MISYETLPVLDGRSVRHIPGVGTQERPMSKRYLTTDPNVIASKLTEAGFSCTIHNPRAMKGRQFWNTIVQARDMTREHFGYVNEASIHCAHDGRHSLAIRPGALRLACYNQFQSAPIRIQHTDPALQDFLDNPADMVRDAILAGYTMAERVESLHGVGDGHYALNRLAVAAPRLAVAAHRYIVQYQEQAGELSFWSVLQAFTAARKPGLLHLSNLALNEGWAETQTGLVPAVWEEALTR